MLQAELPDKLKKANESSNETSTQVDQTANLIIAKSYVDFDHFVVEVAHQQHPQAVFKFTFTREGLFSWKLTGLTLPKI